ncbi:ImpA family metalloprotease [Simiduia sp. 21SJ11W-1]|uniref:ImpA family metalloprotease n=1 Tax=Simiduia sp. 21SJ11W-1 TaxID=2909669 RepID=UPI00209DB203|nr:ImpA family metalloprotease [Simiduia sp. 21SJ11W-1]UTA46708.1 ImpA family metalloprotease [Simiduia sp. 21SJ11W-1]
MSAKQFLLFSLLITCLTACGGGKGSSGSDLPSTAAIDNSTTGAGSDDSGSDNTGIEGASDTETPAAEAETGHNNGAGEPPQEGQANSPYAQDVAMALATGDARFVVEPEAFLAAALETFERDAQAATAVQRALFEGQTAVETISWNPTPDAALLAASFGVNAEILVSNRNKQGEALSQKHALAVAGTKAQGRYAVFGSNPVRHTEHLNDAMHQLLRNTIAWLTGKPDLKHVVLAQLGDSYWFRDEPRMRAWLQENYGEQLHINTQNTCNGSALANCLTTDTDLLVISQVSEDDATTPQILDAIKWANSQGIGVLYVHHDGNLTALGAAIFNHLNVHYVKDNYWPKEQVESFEPTSLYGQLPDNINAIKTTISHLLADDFTFNIQDCEASCSNILAYEREFAQGAAAMRTLVNSFDTRNENLFHSYTSDAIKLAVLFADAQRLNIRYPLTPGEVSTRTWLASYFADHAVHIARDLVPAQQDLGNFSRSNFDHITPTQKQVRLNSKQGFRAAGVYALPGHAVKVTRTDTHAVTTYVRVNSLRASSTHEWTRGGYKRPKFLTSEWLPLPAGEEVIFTSPYGGPVQVQFSAEDGEVELNFNGVGLHPYWASQADDDRFENALALGHFDWAELSTPAFEVHSKLDKMRKSASQTHFPNATALAAGAMQYSHNYALLLAGFKGPGIDVVDEIHNFAASNGLEIKTSNSIKHMNADQPTCGAGCSGNPYDASWSYSPTGHGDLHEIGHGLERGRFRFPDWEVHTTTNPYSYYAKSQFHKSTGHSPDCQKLPFKSLFETLTAAENSADPIAYMREQSLGVWNKGVAIYIQMMMGAQAYGELENGWHQWARLHIIERAFGEALRSEALWAESSQGLGFGNYTFAQAQQISNTDFMLVAMSHAGGLDYRNYFTLWGFETSEMAQRQVAHMQHPEMPKVFFAANERDYCENFSPTPISVTANARWPE